MKDLINKFSKRYGSNSDNWDWNNISLYYNLSEDLIREFQYKVKWNYISSYQKLSEDFIREFQYKVNWYHISSYQNLSGEFIKEFKDKVDFERLFQNIYCPIDIKAEYIRKNVTKEDPSIHSIEEVIEKKDNSLEELKRLVGV